MNELNSFVVAVVVLVVQGFFFEDSKPIFFPLWTSIMIQASAKDKGSRDSGWSVMASAEEPCYLPHVLGDSVAGLFTVRLVPLWAVAPIS